MVAGVALATASIGCEPPPSVPAETFEPAAADVVASVAQVDAGWDLGLRGGGRFLLTDAVRDLLRPSPGGAFSPRVGDLLLTDSLSTPSWVAFSAGGGGPPGRECFQVQDRGTVSGDRVVLESGLSVPIGNWRDDPPPQEGATFAGICLDASGRAVEALLGLG